MKKIVLTGGGTAGHVMPNIALLPYLTNCEIHYIGGNGIEKSILSEHKEVIYHEIPCVKYTRNKIVKNLLIPFKLFISVRRAKKVLRKIAPDVIFGKGGYVSLPVALAKGKIPLIVHESDLSLGLTNKLIAKKCVYVCTSFDVTANNLRNGLYTGALIRRELFTGKRTTPQPTLLIMGGSLGSEAINHCVAEALDELTMRYNVVHIVGKGNKRNVKKANYLELEFAEMADIYAGADLIVSRGGANSLFEIAALNKKALVIPLPKGASRGDQVENAAYFEKKGLVKVLKQEQLTKERFLAEIESLAAFTPSKLNVLGTKKVAKLLLDLPLKKS